MLPPRAPRFDALDAWRGVACLAVLVFHCTLYTATPAFDARVRADGGTPAEWALAVTARGWVGVPVFFVISGYCIAASADAARRRPRPAGQYFVRRFRRIYPPLWACVAASAAGVAALPPAALPGATPAYDAPVPYPWDVPAGQWLGTLTLTEEWRHYFGGPDRGYFLGQVWTLCYEEQFYLVVGAILLVARRRLFPAVAAVTALVAANSFDWDGTLGLPLNRFRLTYPGFFFDGMWYGFAAGVAVYYRRNYAGPRDGRMIEMLLAAAGIAATAGLVTYLARPEATGPKYTLAATSFAFLLCRWNGGGLATGRWAAPLRFCGRMCYSLYLVHAPVTVIGSWNLLRAGLTTPEQTLFVTVPVLAAASVGLSYLFHVAVERRFLNAPAADKPPAAETVADLAVRAPAARRSRHQLV